jgi:hypothetical protein
MFQYINNENEIYKPDKYQETYNSLISFSSKKRTKCYA